MMKSDQEILNDASKILLIQDIKELDEKISEVHWGKKSIAKKWSVDSMYTEMEVDDLREQCKQKMHNLYNKKNK